jgi:hypothetical protein
MTIVMHAKVKIDQKHNIDPTKGKTKTKTKYRWFYAHMSYVCI